MVLSELFSSSRYFTHQRVQYEIAVSYLTRGRVFLETIFHESIAGVEYGFQNYSSPRKIWNSSHIPQVDTWSIYFTPSNRNIGFSLLALRWWIWALILHGPVKILKTKMPFHCNGKNHRFQYFIWKQCFLMIGDSEIGESKGGVIVGTLL